MNKRTVVHLVIGLSVLAVVYSFVMSSSRKGRSRQEIVFEETGEPLTASICGIGPASGPGFVVVLEAVAPPDDLVEKRFVPIVIGENEGLAIAMKLAGVESVRPGTHDLLTSVIRKLNGEVRSVVVTDMRDGIFYATIRLERGGRVTLLDARPSDSMALAIRSGAPILVTPMVLMKSGCGRAPVDNVPMGFKRPRRGSPPRKPGGSGSSEADTL